MNKWVSKFEKSRVFDYAQFAYQTLDSKITPFPKRIGSEFLDFYKKITKSQNWSQKELENYQLKKLIKLINHCYKNVPYYTNLFDKLNLKPKDFKKISDLQKLPILDKETIRKNYNQLISQNVKRGEWIESHTSGSTGTPLIFLLDKDSQLIEYAFTFRAWSFGKYELGDKVVVLRSYVPKPNQLLYHLDKRLNYLYLSAYHLNKENMNDYVKRINKFDAKILRGYPSSLYIFARFLNQEKIKMPNIKTIISSSETLLPQYREEIEKAFDAPVLDWYGCNERVITLEQCETNQGYHTNSEYGILEVVDEKDNLIKSGRGFIIGTSLENYVMPLIRYRVGDVCNVSKAHKCKCGRGLPLEVESIEGRSDEILQINGVSIPPINFYTMFHEIPNLIQFQLIQKDNSKLLVKLVVTPEFSDEKKLVIEGLKQRTGKNTKIEIKIVPSIGRDLKTGKIKCIVNEFTAKK